MSREIILVILQGISGSCASSSDTQIVSSQ